MNSSSTLTVTCAATPAWSRPSAAAAASALGLSLPAYQVSGAGVAKHAQKRFAMADTIDTDGWPSGPRDGTSG